MFTTLKLNSTKPLVEQIIAKGYQPVAIRKLTSPVKSLDPKLTTKSRPIPGRTARFKIRSL